MLRVFNTNGNTNNENYMGYIIDAYDIEQSIELNSIDALTFKIPINSTGRKYIDASKYYIECNGRLYFPIKVDENDTDNSVYVTCRHIVNLLSINTLISIFPVVAGKSVKEVCEKAFTFLPEDSIFSLFTDYELSQRGLEWVTEKIDLVEGLDWVYVLDVFNAAIEQAKYGELYYENNKIAIVRRIGKDTNYLWTTSSNLSGLETSTDFSTIMNKIYVVGKDEMPLDTVQYPGSFITSQESIDKYGLREGKLSYPDVDNKEELLSKALYEISPLNPDRVDVPKFTVNVSAVDIGQNINIGDTIRIVNKKLNLDVIKRVVKLNVFPNDKSKNSYVIGDKPLSLENLLNKLEKTRDRVSGIMTVNDTITIDGLEQLVPYLQSGKNYVKNSSFEIYDDLGAAAYWHSDDSNITSEEESRFGTRSLKLSQGIKVSTADDSLIDLTKFSNESSKTIVSFYSKGGAVNIFLYDENGEPIPHISSLGEDYVFFTEFGRSNAWGNQKFIIFNNQDCPTDKFKINFQNSDTEPTYIDGVMAQPALSNRMQLYLDGEHSVGSNGKELGTDDLSKMTFTIDKNDIEHTLPKNVPTQIIIRTLDSNDSSKINYNFIATFGETTSNKQIKVEILDSATVLEEYVFCLDAKEDTLSFSSNLKSIEPGPHNLIVQLTNLGDEELVLVKDASKFCLLGKAIKTEEIPPIPVINTYDNWVLIDLTEYMEKQKNIITISGITDEVVLEIEQGE